MNILGNHVSKRLLIVSGLLLLHGCAVPLTASDSAATADSTLTRLESDAQQINLAPVASMESDSDRIDSLSARTDAVIAREAANTVRLNTENLQRQIADTNAHMTD